MIGGISLGSVTGAAKLTPVEVMGASGTADQKVINLSQFATNLWMLMEIQAMGSISPQPPRQHSKVNQWTLMSL